LVYVESVKAIGVIVLVDVEYFWITFYPLQLFQISSKSETVQRKFHSAGAVHSSSHLVEVLLFGGAKQAEIAKTSLLKFREYQVVCEQDTNRCNWLI